MPTLSRILALTDFSASARHAADRAARLAHEAGAELTLLHVQSGDAFRNLQHVPLLNFLFL